MRDAASRDVHRLHWLEAKKDFITCQECDEKVPFVDFIAQRLKSDPVGRKILAMDETAARELDNAGAGANPNRHNDLALTRSHGKFPV